MFAASHSGAVPAVFSFVKAGSGWSSATAPDLSSLRHHTRPECQNEMRPVVQNLSPRHREA